MIGMIGNLHHVHQHGHSNTNFLSSSRRFSSPRETLYTLALLNSVDIRLRMRHFTLSRAFHMCAHGNRQHFCIGRRGPRRSSCNTRRSCHGSTWPRYHIYSVPALCTVLSHGPPTAFPLVGPQCTVGSLAGTHWGAHRYPGRMV